MIKKGKGYIKLVFNPKVYSLSSIYSASYVFLDKVYIYLDKDKNGKIVVWFFPKNKKEDLSRLSMDFCNELINYSHYFNSLKVNGEVIKTLMQRALFSASPSLVQETEEKEIEDLIKELEEEEKAEESKKKN